MLVAIAILAIMLVFFAQMAGSVSQLYKAGKARSDANGVGRAVLDTVTGDLRQAVIRPDLATFVEQDDANARALRFYCLRPGDFRGSASAADGLGAARFVSVVEYVFYRGGPKQGYIARRDRPSSWSSSTNIIPIGQTNTIQPLDASLEESLIYEGVVGMEWTFLRADGSLTNRLSASNTNAPVAIRCSMAVVGADAMRILKDSGRTTEFIQLFAQPGMAGIEEWESGLRARASDFPQPVVAQTRFYERFVALPRTAN